MAPYMYKFSPCGWISLGTGCTGCPPWLYGFADFFASDALNLLFRANSALLNLLFRASLLDLQAFCDFRQLSHHIQKLRAAFYHVMIFVNGKPNFRIDAEFASCEKLTNFFN